MVLDGCIVGVEVDDEWLEFKWDRNRREKLAAGWVSPSRWAVGWVGGARDISGENRAVVVIEELEYPLKDEICSPVSATTLPPTLDDASVVTEDLEYGRAVKVVNGSANEELESNGFCPANVPLT